MLGRRQRHRPFRHPPHPIRVFQCKQPASTPYLARIHNLRRRSLGQKTAIFIAYLTPSQNHFPNGIQARRKVNIVRPLMAIPAEAFQIFQPRVKPVLTVNPVM